jgi:tetratricopeptide (TPR) repeat protein
MEGKKKHNKWITIVAVVVSVIAVYFAFDTARGISHYNRGTDHMANGNYDQAIRCFEKAIEVEGKFPEAYCQRGTAYYEKGDYDRAVPDFDKAIELNPEFAEAYCNRAIVYFYKKQYDKSWEDIRKAQSLGHEIPPNFLEALREISGKQA